MADGGSILGSIRGGEVDPDMQGAPGPDPFEANSAMLQDFATRSSLAQKDKSPFEELAETGVGIKYDKKGLSLTNLDPRLVVGMMEKSKRLDEIMGAMKQEGDRLQRQREQLDTTGGRIGNAVSVLAGNLASARDMPGWVQAAGRTALQLNPTRDQVTDRQMALGMEEAQIGQSQQRLMEARLRAEEIAAYREAEHQRKAEADAAKAAAAEAETARKKEADAEKARHDKEQERLRNLTRVLNLGKAAGGRVKAEDIAGLNPEERAEVAAQMKGIREKEQAVQEQKVALVKLRNEGKMAVTTATIEAKKALKDVGYMNKSAQDALRVRIAGLVSAAAGKHGAHQTAVQTMLTVDPTQVPALLANYAPEEEAFKQLLALQAELETKVTGQPAGPSMSSPEAAAKAKAAGPKKLTYNPATREFE